MAPIIAKMTPEDALKELAPLHKSLVQVQVPVAFPQSNSMLLKPHPLLVDSGNPRLDLSLETFYQDLFKTIQKYL